MNEEEFRKFDSYFYPKSVALIGVSKRTNFFWLQNFVMAGFPGKVFPVNPRGPRAVSGVAFYKSLFDIPESETIDYAVISVPAPRVPQVLRECIKKKVKLATIFSSGFSETGQEQCTLLEKKLISILKHENTNPPLRIIGPNCMGLYVPESQVFFRPDLSRRTGNISFIAQSGGLAINLSLKLKELGIGLAKVISFGNQIDLTCTDFLEYLMDDDKTKIICMYIEGLRQRDKPKFFKTLQEANLKKPIIFWKGGRTEEGSKAAASHTGAIAGSMSTWGAVLNQAGIIKVDNFEELVDIIVTLKHYDPKKLTDNNINKKTVLISISGGSSVTNTDEVIQVGLKVPKFKPEIQEEIRNAMMYDIGVNYSNPIDLASDYFNARGLKKINKMILNSTFSNVIFEISLQYVYIPYLNDPSLATWRDIFYKQVLKNLKQLKNAGKIVGVALTDICYPQNRIDDEKYFLKKVPVFRNVRDAAKAFNSLIDYTHFLEKHKN
ncbi:MAG: CoA-binding protein [Candidatus Helarchaeota archaeon]